MQHDFILLDRSGSMSSLWNEAINSINSYVKGLADKNVDTGVTLAVFDSNNGDLDFQVIRERITPKTWNNVLFGEAAPRGMTPLNDAVGKLVSIANQHNYDKVAIIIMTDGAENASKEFSTQQAKDLLEGCRKKNWQVVFLGANYDNVSQAKSYNNATGSTVRAAAGKIGASMALMSDKRALYSTTGANINYSDEEKAALSS